MARARQLKLFRRTWKLGDGTVEDYLRRAPVLGAAFWALCEHPYGLTRRQLTYEVYHGSKEPNYPTLSTCIVKFNQKAKAGCWGLRIHGHGGPGSKYQIWVCRDS